MNDDGIKTFKRINYVAGFIQLILCIFLIVWFIMELTTGDSSNNVGMRFNIGEYNGNGTGRSFGDLPVSAVVAMLAIFTCITSCVHIFAYARAGPSYQESVDNGKNWKRWVEYSITATIMMVVIALSSGIGSIDTLALLTVGTLCCMVCGWISEESATTHKKISKVSTTIGWALLFVVIGVIMRRFGSIVMQANTNEQTQGPPWWVFCIVISMFLLYSSFGIIHLVHMWKRWKLSNSINNDVVFNRRIEGAYTTTSMIAKSLLVIFLASGLFARDSSNDDSNQITNHVVYYQHNEKITVTNESDIYVYTYKKELLRGIGQLLNDIGVRYVISHGNLLEYTRNERIYHDDDLDIRICEADKEKWFAYCKNPDNRNNVKYNLSFDNRFGDEHAQMKNGIQACLINFKHDVDISYHIMDIHMDVVMSKVSLKYWVDYDINFSDLRSVMFMDVATYVPNVNDTKRILSSEYGHNYIIPNRKSPVF